MKRMLIYVSGRVQGVFYRAYAKKMADQLGVNGIIRNEPDGRVYLEAEGSDHSMAEFILWCKKGSPGAQVLTFVMEETEPIGYVGFRIIR